MSEDSKTKKESAFVKKTVQSFDSVKKYLMADDKRTTRRKLYSSIWAVVFGLIFASIIYMILGAAQGHGVGAFDFIKNVFKFSFDSNKQDSTAILFIFFGFAGLAVAIGFKSGLFNIGISGQMTMPAILFFAILVISGQDLKSISESYFIGMFFVFILGGALVAALSGILKAFFNVHEVISTIFLNWIIVFIYATLFDTTRGTFSQEHLKVLQENGSIINGQLIEIIIPEAFKWKFIYFGIALFFIVAIGMWFVYSRTTLGYKIKMIGLNKTNSKYVGINEKVTTILIMFLSGALAGIAGFFYIVFWLKAPSLQTVPVAIGFESIAVALIALNSPIGVIPSAALYGILYSSQDLFSVGRDGTPQLDSKYFPIVTGVIIFMTALSIIFYKFRIIDATRKYAVLFCHKEYWINFKNHHKLTFKNRTHKTWDKEENRFRSEWLENHSNDEKSLLSNQYKLALSKFKKQWFIDYKLAKKQNAVEIANLKNKYKENLKNLKAQLANDSANIKDKKNDDTYYALYIKHLQETNNLSDEFNKQYIDLYNKYNVLSYRQELRLIKRSQKPRLKEFSYYQKKYDTTVSKLILENAKADTKQLMNMYDEISKLKFELQRKRIDLGLGTYQDLVNKHKAQRRNTKLIYKSVKNEIFENFEIKYFKKPYKDLVVRYTPILDEKGENI
ncbi:ABC transporter permease [Mycoplasmopsis verecunda]|uniref:Simple sugar transport system permease protein n=1 Tax=Mycoplasmopsis verecunda TaxID=171291 RepID=A0A1T4L3K3_9BACT|nr:ABC transporter permease [Mycoplasmopsis verecunda]WPB54451.1 hypothetical protein SAM46_03115 [Mycoplasmopsis verecunda]SJZ49100.1 simple sugar transport system permease protein [Mycoplasmopsis verecunda]